MSEFKYKIRYIPGPKNVVADALSRNPINNILSIEAEKRISERDYLNDDDFRENFKNPKAPFARVEDILFRNGALCVPEAQGLRRSILYDTHDSCLAGHLGTRKTAALVKRDFFWPGMNEEIEAYVKSCDKCQRNKSVNMKPAGLLQPLPIPSRNWEQITMDFIVKLPQTARKHDAIVVFVDKLSKLSRFIPTETTVDAREVAQVFFREIFRHHGLPKTIISDRDTKFTGNFWKELYKILNVKLALSSAFHPQSDGQTERANRTLEEMLRSYVLYDQDNWDLLLPYMEFAYNNSVNDTTGQSPFFLNSGQHPYTPWSLLSQAKSSKVQEVTSFLENMRQAQEAARNSIEKARARQEHYADKKRRDITFKIGDKVLLSTKNFTLPVDSTRSKKLTSRYAGPYEIIEVISKVAYRPKLPEDINIHPVFHVSLLKPYDDTDDHDEPEKGLIPEILPDGATEFVVEKILDSRTYRRQKQYLVKWKGLSTHESTWEPLKHLKNAPDAIEEYHQRVENDSQLAGEGL